MLPIEHHFIVYENEDGLSEILVWQNILLGS